MWTDESERVPPGVTPVRCPAPAELLGKPRCNTQPGSLKRHRREPASSLTGNHAEAGEAVASPTDTDVMCLLIKHHSMQMISGVPAGAAAHTKSRASFPHQRRQTAPINPPPPALMHLHSTERILVRAPLPRTSQMKTSGFSPWRVQPPLGPVLFRSVGVDEGKSGSPASYR